MKKTVFSLSLLFIFGGGLMAQTADEIMAKSIEARGGAAKLNGLKSLRMEGTLNVMGMDIPTKSTIVSKRGMRNEMEAMGQAIIVAIDGEKGWMINPMAGGTTAVPLPEDQLKASMSQLDLAGMANYKEAGTTTELLGKETLDGAEVYKVKMVTKDSITMTHFIDTKTYYVLKTVMKVNTGGQEAEVETKMSDYKMVDGIAFPHTTQISNPQAGLITTTITKVEVNPTIDESIFAMPKN